MKIHRDHFLLIGAMLLVIGLCLILKPGTVRWVGAGLVVIGGSSGILLLPSRISDRT